MAAHKDIRIPFDIGGRHYEAVGFLNDEETSIQSDQVLDRVGESISADEFEFLTASARELPEALYPYELSRVGRSHGGRMWGAMTIKRVHGNWYWFWGGVNGWNSNVLIVIVQRRS